MPPAELVDGERLRAVATQLGQINDKACTQDFRTSGVSQNLTLYTTPVIYLLIDRLRRRSEPAAPAE